MVEDESLMSRIVPVILLDGLDGAFGGRLDAADMLADLGGGACRSDWPGALTSDGDDRKALAGLTGAGRFDGGVQRQQIGLRGDAGDHVDNAVDAVGGFGQFLNDGGGGVGFAHGFPRLDRGVLDLAADF